MTHQTSLIDALSSAGEVETTLSRGVPHPNALVPSAYPDPQGRTDARIRTQVSEKDGVEVLNLDIDVGNFCDDVDLDRLTGWAAGMAFADFGHVFVGAHRCDGLRH